MADAYRYPLTRICLRTGSLTLPLNLIGVFPERGDIVAVDPNKDAEYTLHVEGRRVLGLAPFFAVHDLTPNDELTIRPLEDGRFAFTTVVRPRRPDFSRPEVVGRLVDALVDGGVPMSESEIRALHPGLPPGFPLRQALEREPRLTLHEGRWQPRLAEPRQAVEAPGEPPAGRVSARRRDAQRDAPPREPAREPQPDAAREPRRDDEPREAQRDARREPGRAPEHEPGPQPSGSRPAGRGRPGERSTGTPETSSRDRVLGTAARRAAARAKEDEALAQEREASERHAAGRDAAARTAAESPPTESEAGEHVDSSSGPAGEGVATPADRPRGRPERPSAEADPAALERADREDAARARAEVEAALEAQAAREAEIMALVEADELARAVGDAAEVETPDVDVLDETRRRSRERLAAHAEDDAMASARRQRDDRADRRRSEAGEEPSETFSWDQPLGRRLRLPWLRRREEPKASAAPEPLPLGGDPLKLDRLGDARPVERGAAAPVRVSPAPRPALFAADVGLNSASLPPGDPAKTKRAREAFATLGYRVEGLAHGQLMLHADFGRRFERILVHVLPDDQRLDWAALLARRREAGATHLAVVGDHRDLHRLVAPADLAKSTLWSWVGIDRVLELAGAMPIGPFDLEGHFERDGLFEYGLDRFERTIAKRVQERGAFSAVLERLAILKAPAVFLLEDVAGSSDVPREQALRVLERLAEAPWHLVSRIDSGEFCLRYRVHDALDQIGAYAASLRVRLPERQRDRVRGLPDDFDPIEADDVPAHAAAPAGETAATAAPDAADEKVRVPVARRPARAAPVESKPAASSRLFAGPGLGTEDEADADEVDVSLVDARRGKRRR